MDEKEGGGINPQLAVQSPLKISRSEQKYIPVLRHVQAMYIFLLLPFLSMNKGSYVFYAVLN